MLGIEAFQNELSRYKGAKGSIQFPLDEPIPYDLVKRIVTFRIKEVKSKA
jgi:uncharacterized protein YdhG (YjbR/CyaY superfamily)